MNEDTNPTPGMLPSMLTLKCPRCRRGNMFVHKNPYKKLSLNYMLEMYETCTVCKQRFVLEPGFYFGTGYVSYGVTVAISFATCLIWWLTIGFSTDDNRIFYWLLANALFIVALQPWVMRLSRSIYIYIFVKYNPNFDKEEAFTFK